MEWYLVHERQRRNRRLIGIRADDGGETLVACIDPDRKEAIKNLPIRDGRPSQYELTRIILERPLGRADQQAVDAFFSRYVKQNNI